LAAKAFDAETGADSDGQDERKEREQKKALAEGSFYRLQRVLRIGAED